MAADLRTSRPEFRQIATVLRDRWLSIVIIVTAVLASTVYFTVGQADQYRSEARVVLNSPLAAPGANPNTLFNMETEAGIAASPAVADIALQEPGIDGSDAADLLQGLEVESGGTQINQILRFAYTDEDPEEAQDRAQAFAEAYLDYRVQQLEATVKPLQDELVDAQEQLDEIRAEMGETDDPSTLAQLQSRATQLNSLMVVLQQRLGQALPGTLTRASVGDIVQPATLPREPSGPNFLRNLLLALVVALLLAVGTAIVRDAMQDHVRDSSAMERSLNGRVIATIPRARIPRDASSQLAMLAQPDSATAQGYGELRAAIHLASRRSDVILITSSDYGEAKSETAANLGVALAQSGDDVILISADLRQPMLEGLFNQARRGGLTSVLRGKQTLDRVLRPTRVSGLRLLPAGPAVKNPSISLGLDRMGEILGELRSGADVIIIDAAPVLRAPDAAILAPHADLTILVADAALTRGRSVMRAAERLTRGAELPIVGVLIESGRGWFPLARRMRFPSANSDLKAASSDGSAAARRRPSESGRV
jgi:capsular exopolysaccharide synthesis family protein